MITADVPSATTINATGCAPGVTDVTDFGDVLPGTPATTGADCVVLFGSSNDTSMLRLFQTDGGGDAMLPAPMVGTLAMWSFNGTMQDLSATANHGDPLPAASRDPAYVPGPSGRGQALDFDGNDYATIPHHASYNTTTFTVDAWVRTTDTGAVIAARETAACGNGGLCQWELYLDGSGRIVFEIEVGSTWHGPTAATPINDGAWHHVAMTVDDATKEIRGYVDGQYIGSDSTWSAGTVDVGTIPIILGENGDSLDRYVGELDELRHQPGILSATDFKRYYQGRVTDYANTTLDWDTDAMTTNMFGVCLDSAIDGAATDGSTFVPNAGCPQADGTGWRAIAATSADAASKVAYSPTGDLDGKANLRFGFRPKTNQVPGDYEAPLTFEVIAPNA